jgi:hypothetical protein
MISTFKTTALLLLLLLAPAVLNSAQAEEYKKQVKKQFNVKADATLKVVNQYGKVHATTWDKNEITIDVEIIVESKSKEDGDEALKKIEVKFTESGNMVEAITEIDLKSGKKQKCKNFEINYTINLPKKHRFIVDNRFGDVFISELEGKALLTVGYGTLTGKRLEHNDNEVNLAFSTGTIDYLKKGKMKVKYSTLNINESEELTSDLQFSTVSIKKINALQVTSKYDAIAIGEVDRITGEIKFTSLSADKLSSELKLGSQYGAIEVDDVAKDFKSIDIDTQFAPIDLKFEKGVAFKLDATVNAGDISYPKGSPIKKTEISMMSSGFTGTIGEGSANALVTIKSKYGDVSLTYRQ